MAWDDDKATGDEVTSTEWDTHVSDQKNHNTRHEQGGSDELDVSGLSGILADPQSPNEEEVEDIVSGLLAAGDKLGLTYDDANDTLTIDTTALDEEEVEDAVASLVTAGNAITVNYDDPNDTLTIGVDESALSFYDGTNLTADVDNQSLSTDDSVTVTTGEATNTLHYGSNQDRANAGDESVAIGIGARANGDDGAGGTIGNHAAIGYQAARNNTGFGVTATGTSAARDNTGDRVTATGLQAAQNNTGFGVTATAYKAARDNTGDRVTATAYKAAENNTGNNVTASGRSAARGDGLADPTTMGDDNIGIGDSAIRNNQASGLIAIGQDAGINAQTDDQLIITDRNGNRRMTMDLTNGNLNIDGSLNENATL